MWLFNISAISGVAQLENMLCNGHDKIAHDLTEALLQGGKTIPTARCGVDLIIQAKSGTGKTCVFVVVALESVILSSTSTQVIILAPTREIACQIYEAVRVIGRHMEGLKCACFIGGKVTKDDKTLAKNSHIVVGSPGRISQLVQDGDLSVDGVRLFVLDEADKLMEESYQENINWIYSKLPINKQFLVLSATYPRQLDEFLKKYMRNPQMIKLDSSDAQLIGIKQYIAMVKVTVGENWLDQRIDHLHKLLSKITFSQCLIFCNFQDKVEYLCTKLKERQWPAEFIGAHISQSQRLSVMKRLKTFRCRILISTDLTARGIDAEHVNLVINFDIPYTSETYLHRIGRAGRFGGYGASITLLSGWQAELNFYQMVETYKLRVKKLPDDFPLDIVANVAFYDQMPQFEVPNLTIYEQKAVVKAAKKTARAIGHENYAKITRNVALKRATAGKSELTQFTLCSPTGKASLTLKYDRDSMLNVLKQVLGLSEEPISALEAKKMTKYEKSAGKQEDKRDDVPNEEQLNESISIERIPEIIVLNDLSDGSKQKTQNQIQRISNEVMTVNCHWPILEKDVFRFEKVSNLNAVFPDMAHKDSTKAENEKNPEIFENPVLTESDVKQLEAKRLSPSSLEGKLYQNVISDLEPASKCTSRILDGPGDLDMVQESNGSPNDEKGCDRSLEIEIQSFNIGEEPSKASEFSYQGPEVASKEYSPEELKLSKTREPSTSDYLRAFCNSYDDYLCQIYAVFSWRKMTSSFNNGALYGINWTTFSQKSQTRSFKNVRFDKVRSMWYEVEFFQYESQLQTLAI